MLQVTLPTVDYYDLPLFSMKDEPKDTLIPVGGDDALAAYWVSNASKRVIFMDIETRNILPSYGPVCDTQEAAEAYVKKAFRQE